MRNSHFILGSAFCIVYLDISWLSIAIGYGIIGASVFLLSKKCYQEFFIVLLLSSYHSNGITIFNSLGTGISMIYPLSFLFVLRILYEGIAVRRRLALVLCMCFFAYSILGYTKCANAGYFIIDNLRWFLTLIFVIAFIDERYRHDFWTALLQYAKYLYPMLIIVVGALGRSVDSGREIGTLFDETGSLAIMLLLGITLQRKRLLGYVYFAAVILAKSFFFYIGSFEIIGVSLVLIGYIMNSMRINPKRSIALVLSVILILSYTLNSNWFSGNSFTAYKARQILFLIDSISFDPAMLQLVPFSPRIRILEILNIWAAGLNDPLRLLLGSGWGSYFEYSYLKASSAGISTFIDTGSYSLWEISESKYYQAHNTVGYLLHKVGLLGLLGIVYVSLKGIVRFVKSKEVIFLACSVYLMMNIGYGLKNMIVCSAITLIILYSKNDNSRILFSARS